MFTAERIIRKICDMGYGVYVTYNPTDRWNVQIYEKTDDGDTVPLIVPHSLFNGLLVVNAWCRCTLWSACMDLYPYLKRHKAKRIEEARATADH